MKITLEHYGTKISAEKESDNLDIHEVFSELIVPVLTGAGFSEDAIIAGLDGVSF